MRKLTPSEINKLSKKPNVKTIAVQNFLMSMGRDEEIARRNFNYDSLLYSWNSQTRNAILRGISLASK